MKKIFSYWVLCLMAFATSALVSCSSDGERFNAFIVFVKFFLDRRFIIFHAKQPLL